jgi:hypothetical protein
MHIECTSILIILFVLAHLIMCILYNFANFFVDKLGIGVVHYWGVQ